MTVFMVLKDVSFWNCEVHRAFLSNLFFIILIALSLLMMLSLQSLKCKRKVEILIKNHKNLYSISYHLPYALEVL